jgi:predicted RNA-binding protein Jag
MTKEQTIRHYMAKLGLTYERAEQLWLDEQNDNLPDLTPEQAKVEKEMRQADRKKETAPRKRERKIDQDKRFLIDAMEEMLVYSDVQAENVQIKNPEREIEFIFKNNYYSITLTKHRKEKN